MNDTQQQEASVGLYAAHVGSSERNDSTDARTKHGRPQGNCPELAGAGGETTSDRKALVPDSTQRTWAAARGATQQTRDFDSAGKKASVPSQAAPAVKRHAKQADARVGFYAALVGSGERQDASKRSEQL